MRPETKHTKLGSSNALFFRYTQLVSLAPAGDIYFHSELFAPFPFRTAQRSQCKWTQAWPFTCSHSCFRPQIRLIIQSLVYICTYSRSIALTTTRNKAMGTTWRALSKLPPRRHAQEHYSVWLLVGTSTVLGPLLAYWLAQSCLCY